MGLNNPPGTIGGDLTIEGIGWLGGAPLDSPNYATISAQVTGGGNFLSFRQSDFNNGLSNGTPATEIAEFDTNSAAAGGLYVGTFAGGHATEPLVVNGNGVSTTALDSGLAAIDLIGGRINPATGTGIDLTAPESIVQATNNWGSPLWMVKGDGRVVVTLPNSAPSASILANGQGSLYVDEAGKAIKLDYKDSGGTVRTSTLGTWP